MHQTYQPTYHENTHRPYQQQPAINHYQQTYQQSYPHTKHQQSHQPYNITSMHTYHTNYHQTIINRQVPHISSISASIISIMNDHTQYRCVCDWMGTSILIPLRWGCWGAQYEYRGWNINTIGPHHIHHHNQYMGMLDQYYQHV